MSDRSQPENSNLENSQRYKSQSTTAAVIAIFAVAILLVGWAYWDNSTEETDEVYTVRSQSPARDNDEDVVPLRLRDTDADADVVAVDSTDDVVDSDDDVVIEVRDADFRYTDVERWSGAGSMKTDSFDIDSKHWAIVWSAENPPEAAQGVFQLSVADGRESVVEITANSEDDQAGDTVYFDNGPGTFHLVITATTNWKVRVQQRIGRDVNPKKLEAEEKMDEVRERIQEDKARIAAEKAQNPEAFAEKTARQKLKLAKNLIGVNDAAARERLNEIIDEFPETEAADEARELLKTEL